MTLNEYAEKMNAGGELPMLSFFKEENWNGMVLFHCFVPQNKEGYLLFKLWKGTPFGSPYSAMEYRWNEEGRVPSASFIPQVIGGDDDGPYITKNGFHHFITITEIETEMVVRERTPDGEPVGNVIIPQGDPTWVNEREFFRFAHWES